MRRNTKAFAKQLFGAKYESIRKSLVAAAILFLAVYGAGFHLSVAPRILYFTSAFFFCGRYVADPYRTAPDGDDPGDARASL